MLQAIYEVLIYIYIYIYKKNKNRSHQDFKFISILLWVLININNTKRKQNFFRSNGLVDDIQNRHRKEGVGGVEKGWRVTSPFTHLHWIWRGSVFVLFFWCYWYLSIPITNGNKFIILMWPIFVFLKEIIALWYQLHWALYQEKFKCL